MPSEDQVKAMLAEYKKGGKFKDYVDKGCDAYGDDYIQELHKATIYEYFKSVTDKDGCNREKIK